MSLLSPLGTTLAWLLTAAPASGAEREILIWNGSTQASQAAALQAELRAKPELLPSGLKLASGFPALIESRTLPGLKPGFHIVILGFCPKAEAPRVLSALRVKSPGTYTRTVTVPQAQAATCPALADSVRVSGDAVRRALQPLEEQLGPASLLGHTPQDTATGRLAALVRFQGLEGQQEETEGYALVGLADSPTGLRVLGREPLEVGDKKVELGSELTRLAPHEVAAEVILSFHEPDTSEGETGVETKGSELTLHHLGEEGPSEVLSFELSHSKSDVECTHTRQAEYAPLPQALHEGFYSLRVETVSSDGGCAQVYRDPSQEDPPEGLGTSRSERVYQWNGASYQEASPP